MLPWKVLYIQSLYENKVTNQLEHLNIECYLPKIEIKRQWSDRIKKISVPAFPGYVFVRPNEKQRNQVFHAKGVSQYVRIENRDATIREEEMELQGAVGTVAPFLSPQLEDRFRNAAGDRFRRAVGPVHENNNGDTLFRDPQDEISKPHGRAGMRESRQSP